jgi:predicted nucleic acid-binding protein
MATAQYRRPYVDTSVYLAAINDEVDRAPIAREIFEAASRGDISIVASTFVAAEIIRPRWEQAPLAEDKERIIDEVLPASRIIWVELDLPLAAEARRLARRHGLKPADAVHLASALRANCDILLRWNHRFHVASDFPEIEVSDPYWWGDLTLPL